MAIPTDKKTLHPMAELQQAKELRDAQTRTENKEQDRQRRDAQQLRDLDEGVGFSSDKILARSYGTTRKTIWTWARDPDNPFPAPKKVGANMTRWVNAEIKAHRTNQLIGRLYG
jgi:predicted DNA-binding transcriptional regulator AlpA